MKEYQRIVGLLILAKRLGVNVEQLLLENQAMLNLTSEQVTRLTNTVAFLTSEPSSTPEEPPSSSQK